MVDYSRLNAGDRLWIRTGTRCRVIKAVAKTTPKQVVIDWNGDGRYLVRFRKGTGYRLAGGMFTDSIESLATPRQCSEWDDVQEAKRLERKRIADEKTAVEAKEKNLTGAFAKNSIVTQEFWGNEAQRKDRWCVEIHCLTEEQVGLLAGMCAALVGVRE